MDMWAGSRTRCAPERAMRGQCCSSLRRGVGGDIDGLPGWRTGPNSSSPGSTSAPARPCSAPVWARVRRAKPSPPHPLSKGPPNQLRGSHVQGTRPPIQALQPARRPALWLLSLQHVRTAGVRVAEEEVELQVFPVVAPQLERPRVDLRRRGAFGLLGERLGRIRCASGRCRARGESHPDMLTVVPSHALAGQLPRSCARQSPPVVEVELLPVQEVKTASPSGRRLISVWSTECHEPAMSARFASRSAGTSSYMCGLHPTDASRQATALTARHLGSMPGDVIFTSWPPSRHQNNCGSMSRRACAHHPVSSHAH